MEKILSKIQREYIGATYEVAPIQNELTHIMGVQVNFVNSKISDGVDDDETEDTLIMVDTFRTANGELDFLFAYGNITKEITCVQLKRV